MLNCCRDQAAATSTPVEGCPLFRLSNRNLDCSGSDRQRVFVPRAGGLGDLERSAAVLYPARPPGGKRIHREFQRSNARRVFERGVVLFTGRCATKTGERSARITITSTGAARLRIRRQRCSRRCTSQRRKLLHAPGMRFRRRPCPCNSIPLAPRRRKAETLALDRVSRVHENSQEMRRNGFQPPRIYSFGFRRKSERFKQANAV
jgi:hypothetical protein